MIGDTQSYPIDSDAPDKGTIEYKMNTPSQPGGVFSLSYYCRPTHVAKNDFKAQDEAFAKPAVYRNGIMQYLLCTQEPEFSDWKVIIYVDEATLAAPLGTEEGMPDLAHQREIWSTILAHPNLVLATVRWPEYTMGDPAAAAKEVDNSLLRIFRYRAFQDFPSVPVFVRDADTLFENLINKVDMVSQISKWEATLLHEMRAKAPQYQFLVASQPHYNRDWHIHPATKKKATGCYAGLTCSLGGIEEWTSGKLWKDCLTYVRNLSHRVEKNGVYQPSDHESPLYIGKDEQLLMFVIVPALFDRVYFYYMEYIEVEGKVVKDAAIRAMGYERYPSPYLKYQGREDDKDAHGFKDANETTEMILISPKMVGLSMEDRCHRLLQHIFRSDIQRVKGTHPMKGGARRGSTRKLGKKRRGIRRKSHRRRFNNR